MLNTDDVHAQSAIFHKYLLEALDTVAPIVTKQFTRPPLKWITTELEPEMNNLRNLQAAHTVNCNINLTNNIDLAGRLQERCRPSRNEVLSQRASVRKLMIKSEKDTHLA